MKEASESLCCELKYLGPKAEYPDSDNSAATKKRTSTFTLGQVTQNGFNPSRSEARASESDDRIR